jgi:hypothetical protein
MMPRHIGLDLDNTLIDFDAVFPAAGLELGLLPREKTLSSKDAVKTFLSSGAAGEELWMRLQGQVYGRFISRARLYDGAEAFLRAARHAGCRLSIVSHKTKLGHFDPGKIDLWNAATEWLEDKGFFTASGIGMSRGDVHFSESREGKLDLIQSLGCEVFIDDLPEVLNHPRFPQAAARLWFAAGKPAGDGGGLAPHRSWAELALAVERLV